MTDKKGEGKTAEKKNINALKLRYCIVTVTLFC